MNTSITQTESSEGCRRPKSSFRRSRVLRSIFLLLLLLSPLVAFAANSVDEGVNAAARGDFTAALNHFKPLADQGDARALYHLGLMHSKGQGGAQDHIQAAQFFRKAAETGSPEAQNEIGVAYLEGRGVV